MNQRGFAFLPFLLGNWRTIAIGLLAAGVIGYYLHCEHVKKDHATFVAKLEAQAEEQLRQNKLKEAADAKRIQDALSDRDAALKRLRSQSRPVSLSGSPTAPTGSSQVCIRSDAYNAAFAEFRKSLERSLEEARGLAIEGDSAAIDAKACVEAWPR